MSVWRFAWIECLCKGAPQMSWSESLTDEQKKAASHVGQHARLLAGPGTGKTRALTARAAYLVSEKNCPPEEILGVTFTRAAAAELRDRVRAILGPDAPGYPEVTTLHSFALQTILRHEAGDRLPQPIRIADDYEERWIIEEDIKRLLNLPRVDHARALLQQLSADFEQLTVDRDDWAKRFPNPGFLGAWREHRRVYGYTLRAELVYQLKLGLQEGTIELSKPPTHLLVDEYQDLNACDLSVIRSLADSGTELFAAGDDDQSIYGFRYANPDGIRRFTQEYVPSTPLTLSECKRCGLRILEAALYVARQDARREDKPLHSAEDLPPGEVKLLHFSDQEQEAGGIAQLVSWLVRSRGVAPEQILVLLRNDRHKRFSEPIREALEAQGVPAASTGEPLAVLETPQGRAVLSLLRLVINLEDSLAWRTLVSLPGKRLGPVACGAIYDLARTEGLTFSQAIHRVRGSPELLSRQGGAIKRETDRIQGIVDQLRAYDQNDPTTILKAAVELQIAASDRERLLDLLSELLAPVEVDNLEGMLREFTVSLGDKEQIRVPGCVNVMTMHQAKGLDAQAVFIAAAEDEYIPGRAAGAQVDDERRLLYVSLTRGREYLYISHCLRRVGVQRYTGRTSGTSRRNLTQFLQGGPLQSENGAAYTASLP